MSDRYVSNLVQSQHTCTYDGTSLSLRHGAELSPQLNIARRRTDDDSELSVHLLPSICHHVPATATLLIRDSGVARECQRRWIVGTHHTLRSRALSGNVTFAEDPAVSSSFSKPVVTTLSQIFKRAEIHDRLNRYWHIPRNCLGGSSADLGNSCSNATSIPVAKG